MIKVSQGCLGQKEVKEVLSTFEYGYIRRAAKVDEFEQKLRSCIGVTFEFAANSDTNAMHRIHWELGKVTRSLFPLPHIRCLISSHFCH